MPGMNGAELARLARAKYPNLPILFLTGFADRAAMTGVPEADIIGKPFADADLAEKVRKTLDAACTQSTQAVVRQRVSAAP